MTFLTPGGRASQHPFSNRNRESMRKQARGDIYAAPFDAMAYNGMQLNGNTDVSQERDTTALALTSGTENYIVDSWTAKFVRAATLAITATPNYTTVPPPPGYNFSVALAATTGLSSLAVGDYGWLSHYTEGFRVSRLAFGNANAQPVSIGFWVYATIAGIFTVTFQNAAQNRSFSTNVQINNAATWQYVTITVPGDVTGTWLNTNNLGLRTIFCFGSGTTNQGVANTWKADATFATAQTTNFYATSANVCLVTGLVILPGLEVPTASRAPFISRTLQDELVKAARLYKIIGKGVAANQYLGTGMAFSATIFRAAFQLSPAMRVAPTGTLSAATDFQVDDTVAVPVGSSASLTTSLDAFQIQLNVASGLTAARAGFLQAVNVNARIKLDARL